MTTLPIKQEASDTPTLLQFHEASIRFGGLTAVAPLSFDLPVGQMAAIIGPNGAGKTTVFNLITGVYAPTEGELLFDGNCIASPGKSLRPHRLNELGIARTFQNIRLFADLSVQDNVRCACTAQAGYGLMDTILQTGKYFSGEKKIHREAADLLDIFGLLKHRHTLARNLSYGDQRKLEIVRALATRPKLLLLDEPSSGMNPSETRDVTQIILQIWKDFDLTVLLIEHHMSVVMGICERVIVLDGGVKIADDVPQIVQNDKHVIAAYLGEPDAKLETMLN
jgi:branched-chain amino acid transport system ATP-binding protein